MRRYDRVLLDLDTHKLFLVAWNTAGYVERAHGPDSADFVRTHLGSKKLDGSWGLSEQLNARLDRFRDVTKDYQMDTHSQTWKAIHSALGQVTNGPEAFARALTWCEGWYDQEQPRGTPQEVAQAAVRAWREARLTGP